MTEIEVLPPARPVAAEAIGQLMAHAEAMSAAKQLADALSDTDMVPKDYKGKPGNAAAAILYGAELGLNPIQSLQQIFIVHGSPAIYARTAVALVMRHGITVQTVSTDNESVTVRATDPSGRTEECTWDIARATLAGYVTNAKYKTNPQEMLYAKAAMECCRKIAPDILLGIPYAREELDLEQKPMRVHSERARGIEGLRDAAKSSDVAADSDGTSGAADQAGNWTPDARRRALNRMHQLFGQGDLPKDARADRLLVTSKLVGRDITSSNDLTDEEIGHANHKLNEWERKGKLAKEITDILNLATIEAANAAEQTEAAEGDAK